MKVLILIVLVSGAFSYKFYQTKIPNGDLVNHPCLEGEMWPGVGHINIEGGSTRNPFGLEFAANNYNWTAVCGLDSDGDGVTNGEELGDPSCVWTEGNSAPVFNGNITHPGVCEPMGSAQCQNLNTFDINCETINQYECEEHDAGIFNITYRIDRTKVPAEETTYICQRFDLPHDKPYHLVGTEPIIDNENVMHHFIAYGCPEDVETDLSETPTLCFGMPPTGCEMIGGWAFGNEGPWCPHNDIGLNVGEDRYKYLYLQYHWNNPMLMDDQYDESGFRLFFTPNIRDNHESIMVTGNVDINIPAHTVKTVVNGVCSADCTQNRIKDQTVYVHVVSPHMHLLGAGAVVVQKRDGQVVDTWLNVSFSYTSPQSITYNPPKELKGGDELYTECYYNSESRPNITTYGDGTQEEMCFVFMQYYPETINMRHCVNGFEGRTIDSCVMVDYFSNFEYDDKDSNGCSIILPTILPVVAILSQLFTRA